MRGKVVPPSNLIVKQYLSPKGGALIKEGRLSVFAEKNNDKAHEQKRSGRGLRKSGETLASKQTYTNKHKNVMTTHTHFDHNRYDNITSAIITRKVR